MCLWKILFETFYKGGGKDHVPQVGCLPKEEKRRVVEKFNLPREFVVKSPFTNFPLKEWSLENWLELIKRINLPFCFWA